MEPLYHIAADGARKGRLGEAELRERIATGAFARTDLCWREGWPDWKALEVEFPLAKWPARGEVGAAPPMPAPPAQIQVEGYPVGVPASAVLPGLAAPKKRWRQPGLAVLGLLGLAAMGLVLSRPELFEEAFASRPAESPESPQVVAAMCHDARAISRAAQQYFLESGTGSVPLSYEAATGKVGGPLAVFVPRIARGYTMVPEWLILNNSFLLAHPLAGRPRTFDAEGRPVERIQGAPGRDR